MTPNDCRNLRFALLLLGAAIVLGFVLGVSRPCHAQERPTETSKFSVAPYVALALGQEADVLTKNLALHRGCVEANVYAYASPQPSTQRLVLTKLALVGPTALAMALFDRGHHHTMAKWVGYLGAGVGGGIAVWNVSLDCAWHP